MDVFLELIATGLVVCAAVVLPLSYLASKVLVMDPADVVAELRRLVGTAPQSRMVPAFTIAMAAASPINAVGAEGVAQFSVRVIMQSGPNVIIRGLPGTTSTNT